MTKKKIFILCFLLFGIYSFSQEINNVKCGFFGNKTIEQRNATFPFKESVKILMISYPNEDGFIIEDDNGESRTSENDSLDLVKFGFKIKKEFRFKIKVNLPIKHYDATKIVELNQNDIDTLSNRIINYKYKKIKKNKPISISTANCFTPRNAILFLNKFDKVISVLEICFECSQYYLHPNSYEFCNTIGIGCDQELDYFKKLFKNAGFDIERK